MYKNAHRLLATLSKQVHNSVTLTTASFVNNNISMTAPAISKISLSAFTCNITKRFCSKTFTKLEDEPCDNSEAHENNPSTKMQKEIQAEAQKKLDELLASKPDTKKLYHVIELEIDLLRQSGGKIPTLVKSTDWLQLLTIKSPNRRRAYLEFLWINEIKRLNDKLRKKEKARLKLNEETEETEEKHLKYGLNNNTMFHRIYKTKINAFYNSKLINAMMFGEKLIFDFGYESEMTSAEKSSCAKQFMFAFSSNRENIDPFDIIMCNVDLDGELFRRIRSFIPTLEDPDYPVQVTTKSYLELFPINDLVYLTPHTTNCMQHYDPNKIYIIGGLVDKAHSKPLSLAKAKEQGIHVAKFPLDKYVDFLPGSNKVLNINHCSDIMLTIKNTGSWDEAFKFVPSRKIARPLNEYKSNQVFREIRNVEPKYSSGHASHLSDAAYNKLKSLTFNQK